MIDLILNIAINIEWLNSMFLTALSVITLVNIPLSHHAPCIPIMFSSSIFSKLNSIKYSKSIMNVLRIVLLRYVTSQRMKKSVTKLWKYVLCIYIPTYIELFGRHQNATSSSFSAHSLSLSPQNPILPSCQQTSSKVSHIAYADIYVRLLLLLLLLLTRTKAGIAVSSNGDSRSKSPIRESVTREEFFWLVSEHTCFG